MVFQQIRFYFVFFGFNWPAAEEYGVPSTSGLFYSPPVSLGLLEVL
jgi:hypothetical protein